jgi:hypothetical protein
MTKKTLEQKIIDAHEMASKWLADGNEASEKGNHAKAERCYEKSQFWLDRAHKLEGVEYD